MKVMRMILIALAMLTIAFPCMAEQSEDKEDQILDAVKEMQKWIDKLDEAMPTIEDEDSQYVVGQMIDKMNLAHSVAYTSILADTTISEEQKDKSVPVYSWKSCEDEGYGNLVELQSDMVVVDSGLSYACSLTYHDCYYCVIVSTYDENCNELLQVRMEIAEKDEELLLTMMLYNAQEDYVARIATWLHGNTAMTVHKQVFGSQMDIILKPKEWCEGKQELVEFNEKLLLPAM